MHRSHFATVAPAPVAIAARSRCWCTLQVAWEFEAQWSFAGSARARVFSFLAIFDFNVFLSSPILVALRAAALPAGRAQGHTQQQSRNHYAYYHVPHSCSIFMSYIRFFYNNNFFQIFCFQLSCFFVTISFLYLPLSVPLMIRVFRSGLWTRANSNNSLFLMSFNFTPLCSRSIRSLRRHTWQQIVGLWATEAAIATPTCNTFAIRFSGNVVISKRHLLNTFQYCSFSSL